MHGHGHGRRAARVPVLALLVAAAALALMIPFATAQPWPGCDEQSGCYSAGSAYANNLLQLIVDLRDNASFSPALFASGSAGAGTNAAVYGILLCRGDISSSDCFDCGTRAGRDVDRACNRTRDTALVYNQCYARVAATDFLASPNNTGLVPLQSGTNISTGVDVAAYDTAVTRLLNATSQYAAKQSPKLFATGQLVGLDPSIPNIWSTAQCAGDMSPAECRRCLDDLLAGWWGRYRFPLNGEGARIAGSQCNLRSELGNVFYSGSPMVKLQRNGEAAAPAPSTDVVPATGGGKNNSPGKLLGIILPIVFVAVVAAITLYIWNARKKRRSRGTKLPRRNPPFPRAMCGRSSSLASVLLALLALPFFAAAELHWSNCDSSSGSYSAGSTYQDNLVELVSTLRSEIANGSSATSPDLFTTATAGKGRDAAYGLVLCRGDLSFSDCQDCVISAGQDVGSSCDNRTRDVALCYNLCYVRVSGRDFRASANNSGEVPLISGTNISSSVDAAVYAAAVTRLLNATVRYAVEKSTKMFATGQLVGLDPEIPSIWSTAQCALDLSPEQCRRCLEDLVARWWEEFPMNGRGARIAGSRCNLRSELGSFYTGEAMVKLQAHEEAAAPTVAVAPAPSQVVVAGTVGGKKNSTSKLLGIILPIGVVVALASISLCLWSLSKKRRSHKTKDPPRTHSVEDFESIKSTLLSLSSLQEATNNFGESNKLGEGGFGAVYKGVLSGQEVAVKRLSKGSNQGLEELRNELVLVAKLHHKNLVRLEGFCLEDGERLLVYEYMTNKSLDTILFDPEEKRHLDWRKRFNIIEGVARGLQYLHEDSQKKIVHRDLKASNILLDTDMNPKIGDFGLARLFGQDQTRDVTSRIVGTFGYMSPEYVMRGQFSTKLDIYSFGILLIEIVTGRRNCGQYAPEQNEDVISTVWRHWTEGTIAQLIDDSLGRSYPTDEVLKCVNIALLCLQQNPVDRPTMSDIMVMLDGDTSSLPTPARPTFLIEGGSGYSYSYSTLSHLSAM